MKKFVSCFITMALLVTCVAAMAVSGSAASYVTDGLVANYDGSEIADGATVWTDATGNGNDIVDLPNDDTCYFKDGAYHINSIQVDLPDAIDELMGGDEFTVEMVLGGHESIGASFNTFINCPSDHFSLFRRVGNDNIEVKLASNPRPMTANSLALLPNSTVTVTFNVGEASRLYVNGELLSEVECPAALPNTASMFFGHSETSRRFAADYKAMRFYNVALTAEQVKSNYEADAASSGDEPSVPSETPDTPDTPEPVEKGDNLLAGLTYTFEGTIRTPDNFSDFSDETTCRYHLTDGVYADGNPGEGGNVAAYSAGVTSFVFDLGETTKIAGFNLIGYSGQWGIGAPESTEYLVSDDGENWTSVGVVENSDDITTVVATAWNRHEFALDKAASGRYIKVVYNTSSHVWLGEAEAYAEASEQPSETPSEEQPSEEQPSETPEVPTTADNGIVALAVIASLAVAGAVIVKKTR